MADPADKLYENLLVLRCQAGDPSAFGELVERYDQRLRFFVRKMTGPGFRGGGADDLVQDVWLAALRGINRLNDGGALAAWLYRIARDTVFRELRKRRVPTQGWGVGVAEVEAGGADPAGPVEGEEPAEFAEEEVAAVYDAIDQLPPGQPRSCCCDSWRGWITPRSPRRSGARWGRSAPRLHYAKVRVRARLGVETVGNASGRAETAKRKDGEQ